MNRMNTTAKNFLALGAVLALAAPLFAASPASRHAVYAMDESEREANAPRVKVLLHQDTAVAAWSGMEAIPCGEIYAIEEAAPARDAAKVDTASKTAWVWAGAGGAVVAAGVAAWVFLSGDEDSGTRTIPLQAVVP